MFNYGTLWKHISMFHKIQLLIILIILTFAFVATIA